MGTPSKQDPEQLQPESLDWALTHIQRYGDSDLLPVPFEYDAMKAEWTWLRDRLAQIDLRRHETRALEHFMVPKPDGTYRVATRLDPIDAILYAAIVYECSGEIEAARVPVHRGVVFSYRIDTELNGSLFGGDSGWNAFDERSSELCKGGTTTHVARADITDFYSQVSQHRIQSALEAAGVSRSRSDCLEQLLSNWSAKHHSRGIPTGPKASIPLAELCLNDVDHFLLGRGYVHTRYVDDFRIFCSSREEARRAIHDLSEYLFKSHRLTLQAAKTGIDDVDAFVANRLENAELLHRQHEAQKIDEFIEEIIAESGYGFEEEDLEDYDTSEVVLEAIAELFELCVTQEKLQLGLARHLLRRAGRLRTNCIQTLVVDNLDRLVPVLRDVMAYLGVSKQKKTAKRVARSLMCLATESEVAFLRFVREWCVFALMDRFAEFNADELRALVSDSQGLLGLRPVAFLARRDKQQHWVREHKETWKNAGPWDRRAIIRAGEVLPGNERGHWKKVICASDDVLDRVVAKYAL